MPTPLWQILALTISILGLTGTLIAHIIRYAYQQGRTEQRLETVERVSAGHGDIREILAGLQVTVGALHDVVQELKAAIHDIAPRTLRRASASHNERPAP